MQKKYLLIGGAGFIGFNLAEALAGHGADVTIFDRAECPDCTLADNITYIKGDYFQNGIDDEMLAEQDWVILLACSVSPKTSMEEPTECYGQDISSLIFLLDQMKKQRGVRLAFISSGGTIYGNQESEFLDEDMPTYPINHYGILKLAQEKIIMMYNQLYGMKHIVFRLANPYGPGQQISSGVGAITAFMYSIINDEPIHVYGEGNVVRDYIHISDAVEILCRFLLRNDELQDAFPIYNVGSGEGISIQEVIRKIEAITGKKAQIKYLPERDIDVRRNVLSMNKAFGAIGDYSCRSLEQGIWDYYMWIEEESL